MFLERTIETVSRKYLDSSNGPADLKAPTSIIGGVAAFLNGLVHDNASLGEVMMLWLTSPSGGGVGHGAGLRRAAIAALSADDSKA